MRLVSPATVVVAHPRPNSFNHAVAREVVRVLGEAGVQTSFHDLYAENFDPVLPTEEWLAVVHPSEATEPTDDAVLRYRSELAASRGLVVVHPNWWGQPPAVLVGWLDRVLLPEATADVTTSGQTGGVESADRPKLRRMLIVNTADRPQNGGSGVRDTLDAIWRDSVGPALGSPEIERLVFSPMGGSSADQRARWLTGVARAAAWVAGADR